MKITQTFSILIWANAARGTQQGHALFARVTVNGRRAETSLKRKVDPARWNASSGQLKGSGSEARALNNYLAEVKTELFGIYHQMLSQEEFISAEAIKRRFTGQEKPRKTVLQAIRWHNEEVQKKIGTDFVKATATKFLTMEQKVKDFIQQHQGRTDYYLEQLDYRFVTEFEYFLKSKQGIGSNTAMKYIRMLKNVLNESVRQGWVTNNPFQSFKYRFRWPEKQVLTLQELQRITDRDFPLERLQLVKDLFLFSCYTGFAYVAVMQLSWANVTVGQDGETWLNTHWQKTGSPVRVPLLAPALAIIEKYRLHPKAVAAERLFPRLSNQKLNAYLKEIADLCSIEKPLTFHLARHTFATTITLSNGVPIETVSSMLGHSNLRTTQIYAKVVEKKVSEDMRALKNKLGLGYGSSLEI